MGAFHAYDIRGVWNKDFNIDDVFRIGYFLPQLLKSKKILVGRDVRLSSPEIHTALIDGICTAGVDVYDLGLATTPMVYYATAQLGFDASVQITASHNAKEYNGLKVSTTGAMPIGYDNGLGQLEQMIKTEKVLPAEEYGQCIPLNVKPDYIKFLMRFKTDLSNLNIAMDLSNGMAALLVKEILKDEQIDYLFDIMDGSFPNHEPNPLVQANVADLKKLVLNKRSDVGVIYDGDADRVMFVDEKGQFISPDMMIAVLGLYFLKNRPQQGQIKVLQDIRSSKAIGEFLQPKGAIMHTWRVGRAFAARKLKEIDGLFGGELAGHYYFKDFFYSDSGILASLIILDVIAQKKKEGITVSQLIAEISKYHNSGELNFRIAAKQEAMDALKLYFETTENLTAFADFDGYRLEFSDWWFNVRPSNTEPYLRFIAEAITDNLLTEKVNKAKEILAQFE